nr:MAG TPA: hypothetical protein [Caudoviricetes sp.]
MPISLSLNHLITSNSLSLLSIINNAITIYD